MTAGATGRTTPEVSLQLFRSMTATALLFSVVCVPRPAAAQESCFDLALGRLGQGSRPTAEPPYSLGCDPGAYRSAEVVTLRAAPSPGYEVGGWRGTDDDASRELTNTVTMPAADHEAGVIYIDECLELTFSHTGSGTDPRESLLPDSSMWSANTIDRAFESFFSTLILSADINGDGDLDLLGEVNQEIVWFENPGHDVVAWNRHPVDGPFWPLGGSLGVVSLEVGDVDGDGDLDIIGGLGSPEYAISWWENVSGGGDRWERHRVVSEILDGNSRIVRAADFDGDGDLDIAGAIFEHPFLVPPAQLHVNDSARLFAHDVTWSENLTGDGREWKRHDLDPDTHPVSIDAADVDGDGDFDLIGAARWTDETVWWENLTGDGRDWLKHVLVGPFESPNFVQATDVDGDGDTDILGTSNDGDSLRWWENLTGDGRIWSGQTIAHGLAGTFEAAAGDLDNDGDVDVLATVSSEDRIAWWENLSGNGELWSEHTVDESVDGPRWALAGDVDSDGALDVMAVSVPTDTLTWWQNSFLRVCPGREYQAGDRLGLRASPDPGWGVESWSGTENDASTSSENLLVMPTTDHEVAVHYIEVGPTPALSIAGVCPGDFNLSISGATPFALVGLAVAAREGNDPVPAGVCAGTPLDLDSPDPLTLLAADAGGEISIDQVAPDGVCGFFMQVVDTTSCLPSNVGQIPE